LEVKKMKKKLLLPLIFLLSLSLMAPALVTADPLSERNNDKFQTITTTGTFSVFDLINGEHQYIPSFDNVNKFVTAWEEHMLTYTITVGSKTYHLGTDFDYKGYAVETKFDPIFADPSTKLIPTQWRASNKIVEYMFDFSVYPGGIEGTLNMRGVFTQGNGFTSSLSGTDDLQNVQIQQVGLPEGGVVRGIVTVSHEGLVHGWP
jgi:hypothetical protein